MSFIARKLEFISQPAMTFKSLKSHTYRCTRLNTILGFNLSIESKQQIKMLKNTLVSQQPAHLSPRSIWGCCVSL